MRKPIKVSENAKKQIAKMKYASFFCIYIPFWWVQQGESLSVFPHFLHFKTLKSGGRIQNPTKTVSAMAEKNNDSISGYKKYQIITEIKIEIPETCFSLSISF
jgi:hypothetical protein